MLFHNLITVDRKEGKSAYKEMNLSAISYFPIYLYIGYKGISVYEKNKAGPLKSLGAKFHCTCFWAACSSPEVDAILSCMSCWGASFFNIFIFLGGAGILQLWWGYLRGFSTFGGHRGAPRK